jgi:predicted DNA-binding transcriptional regulator AlpA
MIGNCSVCPKTDVRLRRGWCPACYKSWRVHGDPRHRLTARKRPWTPKDRAAVIYDLGYMPISRIARKLHRSPIAVLREAQRRQLSVQRSAARTYGMNTADVVAALGVTRWTVFRWVRRGWLRAQVVTLFRRKMLSIDADDLYAFLCERGALFVLRPSPAWCDLVTQARATIHARYISVDALARAIAISPSLLFIWRDTEEFPAPALTGAHGRRYYDRAAVAAWIQARRPHYWTRAAKEALCQTAIL